MWVCFKVSNNITCQCPFSQYVTFFFRTFLFGLLSVSSGFIKIPCLQYKKCDSHSPGFCDFLIQLDVIFPH